MSPKRWLMLLAFYISYLLFGATIYFHIENRLEKEKRIDALKRRIEINELLINNLVPRDESTQNIILEQVSNYCEKPVTNHTLDEFEEPYRWSFYHSLFFAFTVCSTVGYGNLAPSTTLGQMIMIFYSLIGIPINGILFAGLGEFFGRTFTRIYQRYKQYKLSTDTKYVPRQFGLVATVLIALVPGITFFIVLPALVFSYFEGWPYSLSIYFSYVTTSTIGFGDYVPTFQPDGEHKFGIKYLFYQVFIIIWFIFSLGYLLMIMTFITKGLRSKKLAHLEHQLSVNIKATQSRIWSGVTKDVGYLRRILSELYIMKFKPVYHEPGEKVTINLTPRSASCPDLTMYRDSEPIYARKRAFSENFEVSASQEELETGKAARRAEMIRTSSDTDLQKINKEKTFETARAFMQTTDLLAKVVTALGNIRPIEDETKSTSSSAMLGGYHGMSDSQILASERTWSGWSLQSADNTIIPYIKRGRACSDFHISTETVPQTPSEWTWGGDNDRIQQAINNRVKSSRKQNDLYRASFQTAKLDRSVVLNMGDMDIKEIKEEPAKETAAENKSILKRLKPFKKQVSEGQIKYNPTPAEQPEPDVKSYLENSALGRGSRISTSRQLFPTSNLNRRTSLFSVPSQEEIDQEVLETTTIADLIRALEIMHAHEAGVANPAQSEGPKRKMGTASLTPPSLSPIFTLFPNAEAQPPPTSYSRRPTIFSSAPSSQSPQQTNMPRRMSARPPTDPPPYSERETPKFKRRFSVRPTNLQTLPGMAPPSSAASTPAPPPVQRKISMRPSPLAREHLQSGSGRSGSSRTHSPLTRIAQMQATRQNSQGSLSNLPWPDRKRTE